MLEIFDIGSLRYQQAVMLERIIDDITSGDREDTFDIVGDVSSDRITISDDLTGDIVFLMDGQSGKDAVVDIDVRKVDHKDSFVTTLLAKLFDEPFEGEVPEKLTCLTFISRFNEDDTYSKTWDVEFSAKVKNASYAGTVSSQG